MKCWRWTELCTLSELSRGENCDRREWECPLGQSSSKCASDSPSCCCMQLKTASTAVNDPWILQMGGQFAKWIPRVRGEVEKPWAHRSRQPRMRQGKRLHAKKDTTNVPPVPLTVGEGGREELTVRLIMVGRLAEKARAPLRRAGSKGDALQHCGVEGDGQRQTKTYQTAWRKVDDSWRRTFVNLALLYATGCGLFIMTLS